MAIHTFAGQPSRRSIGPAVGVSGFAMWRSLGVRGLCWSQVLPTAISISHSVCGPVVLVIHAGENDVGLLRMDEILTLMRADLARFLPRCYVGLVGVGPQGHLSVTLWHLSEFTERLMLECPVLVAPGKGWLSVIDSLRGITTAL